MDIIISPDMRAIDAAVYRRYFRHCRFKGGGSTTVNNTSTYTPTEYELEMQRQEANYSKAIAPNALELNNLAMNVLKNSLGTVQVDYNGMNRNAQNQIASATSGMNRLVNSNDLANSAVNREIGNLAGQYQGVANGAVNQLGSAENALSAANAATNNSLAGISNQYQGLAKNAAGQLGGLSGMYTGANSNANRALGQAGNTYGSLAQGNLPTAYQQNMERSISSALNNTLGKTISGLGNRGVLNSSVTSAALNDIEKNAADSVAQQYQNNINQVANLTGQQADTAQQQLGNTFNTAGQLGNITNQQAALQSDALKQQASAAQQQFNNAANTAGQLADFAKNEYSISGDALAQRANAAQQAYQNNINTNSQNSGLLSNIINSATTPITTASVAQEAAQTPASNLWNMSLGLNGATNNALVAAAGKGTTNSTQTTSTSGGGGGFLSGLFGGVMSGIGSGLGAAWCFPAGTKVKMADGTEKSIEYMQEGEEVQTDSGKAEKVLKVMTPHYNDVYNVICENGHTNTTTTQPLMKADGSYINMGDLKIGTELKNVGKVQSIVYSGERRVYDMQVDGENNYIVDGGFVAQGGDESIWQ